ncbi:hypothetical protein NDI76_21965 [Halogeometricum sp. S1BR25-6]|uniref:DUF8160 domain-containing protein n=1 Tax=Halogeometricum salsisoli TaxID=2950536 RepID=A0ABU2GM72_9EURY|nr:hypothetical protein [Halogeometricum sp. S1BR25-6]MDS0301399.1 hypothetical protein [Halogeometricum sp. S1BR25-6]
MSDRNERSSRLRRRFDDDLDDDESETEQEKTVAESKTEPSDKPSKKSKTDMQSETAQPDELSVKDRPSVLMYLPEDIRQELDIRFDELNAKYKREHGEALEKNRDYYPAVIRAGLEGKDLEGVLDI